MRYIETNGISIQKSFEAFHAENPIVYKTFLKFTRDVIKAGHKKYSVKQILGRVRWHLKFEVEGDHDYKINDAFTSRYARMFADDYPEWATFFNYRRLRST